MVKVLIAVDGSDYAEYAVQCKQMWTINCVIFLEQPVLYLNVVTMLDHSL